MRIPTVLALSLASLVAGPAVAQYTLVRSTIDAGGTTLSAGDLELTGTVGQPDAAGTIVGNGHRLAGGFWGAPAPDPCPCLADLNDDCGVDVFDFAVLASAFGRPSDPQLVYQQGDLDGDGDVDVFDFSILAVEFGCSLD